MLTYTLSLSDIPNTTDFSQDVIANTTQLTFHFHWSTEIQEIVDEYEYALKARAQADSLVQGASIVRDYDWLSYYTQTIPHAYPSQVREWLVTNPYIPQSIRQLPEDLQASTLYERCIEADGIVYYLTPLYNRLVWTVEIADNQNNSLCGVVRSNGWLNNQDSLWRVQFVSERAIGRDDLALVTINIEVPDE